MNFMVNLAFPDRGKRVRAGQSSARSGFTADLRLGPGQQAADVFLVPPEDQRRHEQRRRRDLALAHQQRDERRGPHRHQCRKRADPRHQRHQQPDRASRQTQRPIQRDQRPEEGRDPLTAPEALPDREAMPQQRARPGHHGGGLAPQPAGQQHRNRALAAVQQQGRQRGPLSGAQFIQDAWNSQAKWLIVLRPLSWLYRGGFLLNRKLYRCNIK